MKILSWRQQIEMTITNVQGPTALKLSRDVIFYVSDAIRIWVHKTKKCQILVKGKSAIAKNLVLLLL